MIDELCEPGSNAQNIIHPLLLSRTLMYKLSWPQKGLFLIPQNKRDGQNTIVIRTLEGTFDTCTVMHGGQNTCTPSDETNRNCTALDTVGGRHVTRARH